MSIETYGRYQLLKRIATGGMAQIFLARQTGPERFEKLLVVKRILPHLAENADFVQMFLDEARIAARLDHPNIVQIFDLGAQDGTYYIAMEYIHGEDVRRVWKRAANRGTHMPVPLVCRVIMDACAGLDYAHKKADTSGKPLNIVHRDVSPQNILVTFDGGVKVVDFGIAKAADQATVTRSGVLKGKYSYMSPEQANGKKLDCRSDIFALGVVLHELLTGARLFKRANDIQTLNAVTECVVQPPSALARDLPADLDAVVMRALAKEPDQRYQSAGELMLALEEWLIRHQLASSSAHLGAFMQDLYQDRLTREKAEGQVLVDEASEVPRSLADDELLPRARATPSHVKPPPPVPSERSVANRRTDLGLPAMADLENTQAERPSQKLLDASRPRSESRPAVDPLRRSGDRLAAVLEPRFETDRFKLQPVEPGEESLTTEADASPMAHTLSGAATLSESAPASRRRRRRRWGRLLAITSVLAGVAVAGGVGWFAQRAPATAQVRIVTAPPGAAVVLDGQVVPGAITPCTLQVASGTHHLMVGAAGYIDHHSTIEVPTSGLLELPAIRLAPSPPPVAAQVPAEPEAAAPPAAVALAIRSDPPGAAVTLDGKPFGRTPASVQVAPNAELALRVELAGYQAVSRKVKVGAAAREEYVALIRERERTPVRPAQKGQVRFAVVPWARVVCGAHDLGDTPFGDQELPVGTYQCRFTHPEHGVQTRTVEVRPHALAKVSVRFVEGRAP